MFKRIWFCGDIHGSHLPIENFFRRNKDNIDFSPETDLIILLGDAGLNYFRNYRDINVKKKLSKYPFTYFCIRGNHEMRASACINEDPVLWTTEVETFQGPVWIEKRFPNIVYAIDCPCIYYFIEGYKTLVIPGAYSVDKYYRLRNGWSWFEDEQLNPAEMELGRKLIELNPAVDLVLSHTCPSTYIPTDLFLPMIDQSTVDRTMERYLGEVEYKLDYKYWLWGHYHAFRRYPVGEDGRQRIMLSAGQEMILWDDIVNNECKIY